VSASSASDAAQTVVVDLGGTNVRAGLVDAAGTLIDHVKEPVRSGSEPEQIVELMIRMARQGNPKRAVMGTPGRIDRPAGRVVRARNLPWTNLDELSAAHLSDHTGLEVELAGDAEVAAVGESYFGAGSTTGTTAYLTFSTGVGVAAVSDGVVLSGRIGGLQIGFCRSLGFQRPIADVLGSGQRILALGEAIGRPVDFRDARELAAGSGGTASLARAAIDDIGNAAVSIAVMMCHICTPDIIVVGGGLARATEGFLVEEIDRRIRDEDFSGVSWPVAVRDAACGDHAGLLGGAAWQRARPLAMQVATLDLKGQGE
jgi:glucokinase